MPGNLNADSPFIGYSEIGNPIWYPASPASDPGGAFFALHGSSESFYHQRHHVDTV